MTQRLTHTPTFWKNQFKVSDKDIDFLYNLILETNQPRTIDSLGLALTQQRIQEEEIQIRSELQRGELYQPKNTYKIGDYLVFPRLDYAIGKVVSQRDGYSPEYGDFTVIQVTIENGQDAIYEFASGLEAPHPLNLSEAQSLAEVEGLASPQQVYAENQQHIRGRIEKALRANDDFVEFEGNWFLQGLVAEVHAGLLNIVDAAIDISGNPLPVDSLIEQMDLTDQDEISDALRFSVNHQLSQDERFINVGAEDSICWYLRRLTPPQALDTPQWLRLSETEVDTSAFDSELIRLLGQIDDEGTDPELVSMETEPGLRSEATVCLTYPHRRAGTLPLTPKTASFFPRARDRAVYVELVDGRRGNSMPGWVVGDNNYVYGLEEWYARNELPVGAFIHIRRTDDPLKIIVEYRPRRKQREWVRVAMNTNKQLSFQILKAPIGCEFDELMIIGDPPDQASLDALWINPEERQKPVSIILREIFPELSKLNPQSTVHAKTLYSAVNVVRRCTPASIFQELAGQDYFLPMGHGYWIFDPSFS
ncbi:MAG: hypothetical protein ACE5H9_18390 [Anaerolineae bacterium]